MPENQQGVAPNSPQSPQPNTVILPGVTVQPSTPNVSTQPSTPTSTPISTAPQTAATPISTQATPIQDTVSIPVHQQPQAAPAATVQTAAHTAATMTQAPASSQGQSTPPTVQPVAAAPISPTSTTSVDTMQKQPPATNQATLQSNHQAQTHETTSAYMQTVKRRGLPKALKIILPILVIIILLLAGLFLLKDSLFKSSSISNSDLVAVSAEGVDFKRPQQWTEVDYEGGTAFTEDGASVDDTDQGVLVLAESLGIDFSELADDQQSIIATNFEEQFADPSVLEGDGCEQIQSIETQSIEKETYDLSFLIDATCEQIEGSDKQARVRFFFGIAKDQIHTVGVVALLNTWDDSGQALDEILDSVTPTLQ